MIPVGGFVKAALQISRRATVVISARKICFITPKLHKQPNNTKLCLLFEQLFG
jgi:hypothetical protein